jgi:hypothetical protein
MIQALRTLVSWLDLAETEETEIELHSDSKAKKNKES